MILLVAVNVQELATSVFSSVSTGKNSNSPTTGCRKTFVSNSNQFSLRIRGLASLPMTFTDSINELFYIGHYFTPDAKSESTTSCPLMDLAQTSTHKVVKDSLMIQPGQTGRTLKIKSLDDSLTTIS